GLLDQVFLAVPALEVEVGSACRSARALAWLTSSSDLPSRKGRKSVRRMRRTRSTKRLRCASSPKGRCPLKITRSKHERAAIMEAANLATKGFGVCTAFSSRGCRYAPPLCQLNAVLALDALVAARPR